MATESTPTAATARTATSGPATATRIHHRTRTTREHTAAGTAGTPATAVTATHPATHATPHTQPVAVTSAITTTPTAAVSTAAVSTVATAGSPLGVVKNILTGIAGFFGLGTAPTVPGGTAPLTLWTVLAYAQRELQYTFFNRAPVTQPTQTSADVGTGIVSGSLGATDSTGVPLTYRVTSQPANGTVTVDAHGAYTYTPNTALALSGGADAFTVTVSDAARLPGIFGVVQAFVHALAQFVGISGRDTTTVTVPVTVTPIDVPVAGVPTSTNLAQGTVVGDLNFTDPAGSALTYQVSTEPGSGVVTLNDDGTYSYNPTGAAAHAAAADDAPDSAGQDTFTVTATNGYGNSAAEDVTVTITGQNAAPMVGTATTNANADGTVTITPVFTDADGDGLTYAVGDVDASLGTVTQNADGTFTFDGHVASANNPTDTTLLTTVTVTADDGHGGTADESIVVSFQPTNQSPTVGTPLVMLEGDGSDVVNTHFTDPEGDPLAYTASLVDPTQGTLTSNGDGTFTFVPTASVAHDAAAAWASSSTYTFAASVITADDGHGGTASESLNILIQPQNTAPTHGVALVGALGVNGGALIVPNFTDADGDLMTTTSTQPLYGTVTKNSDGTYTYVPSDAAIDQVRGDASLTDSLTITADDGHGGSVSQTFALPISGFYQGTTVTVQVPLLTDPGNVTIVGDLSPGTVSVSQFPPALIDVTSVPNVDVQVRSCATDPTSGNCDVIEPLPATQPTNITGPLLLSNFYGQNAANQYIQNQIAGLAAVGGAGVTGAAIAADILYGVLTAVELVCAW